MRVIYMAACCAAVLAMSGCNEGSGGGSSSSSDSKQSGFTSSSGSSCGFIETDLEALAQQRSTWDASGIDDYRFEFAYESDGYLTYTYNGHYANRVVDGVVVGTENLDDANGSGFPLTFENIFSMAKGRIGYDETYGFVRSYYQNNACAYDAYESLSVTAFETLSEENITTAEHMEAADVKVRQAIYENSCSESAECRSIAYGVKPCGGPESYLIYSTRTVEPEALQALVDVYNDYRNRYNIEQEAVSDCSVVMPPETECMAGTCVVRTSSAASSSSSSQTF